MGRACRGRTDVDLEERLRDCDFDWSGAQDRKVHHPADGIYMNHLPLRQRPTVLLEILITRSSMTTFSLSLLEDQTMATRLNCFACVCVSPTWSVATKRQIRSQLKSTPKYSRSL